MGERFYLGVQGNNLLDGALYMNRWVQEVGFASDNVFVLGPTHAKKDYILLYLKELSRLAKAGDLVVIYFTMHGGQDPDLGGEENDTQDEYFVTGDGKPLYDDELREIWPLFSRGVSIWMIAESCHSGTAYRRSKPPSGLRKLRARSTEAGLIYMGACGDDELAVNGVFTQALYNVWLQQKEAQEDLDKYICGYPELFSWAYALTRQNSCAQEYGSHPRYHEYGCVNDSFRLSRTMEGWMDTDEEVLFDVKANKVWQDTGVQLHVKTATRTVEIHENMCLWSTHPDKVLAHGADGIPTIAKEGYLLPGANEGALVGQAGSEVFVVPFDTPLDTKYKGFLRLAANDDKDKMHGQGYEDNWGSCLLTIKTKPTNKWHFLVNTNTHEVHSLLSPCGDLHEVSASNRYISDEVPNGYNLCDNCFPPGDG